MRAQWTAGDISAEGSEAVFRSLVSVPVEEPEPGGPGWRRIGAVAHISDLHVTDVESPARLDFLIETAEDPRSEQDLPTPRPQQLTSTHAAGATLETVQRLADEGVIDAAILTGDLVDNGQRNEFEIIAGLLTGRTVSPSLDGEAFAGTQTPAWREAAIWRPAEPTNPWSGRYGFPAGDRLAAALAQPFRIRPIRLPTVSCPGNHDMLLAGWVPWRSDLVRIATGAAKPRHLPPGYHENRRADQLMDDPVGFLSGASVPATASASRAPLPPSEFPLALNATLSQRHGSNFVLEITSELTVTVLDTSDRRGLPSGVVSVEQAAWLREVLESRRDEAPDAVTLLASHHGPSDLPSTPTDTGLTAQEMVDLLAGFPSVLGWLTGHTHIAKVRRHEAGSGRALWEITAASIIDWPCQFQTVEVWRSDAGHRVVITKRDFDGDDRAGAWDHLRLAHLHRTLAANQAGFGHIFPGLDDFDRADHTIELGRP